MNPTSRKYVTILDLLSDDYESVQSLHDGDLTIAEMGITQDELEDTLRHAVTTGLADSFVYNVEQQRFDPASCGAGPIGNLWFSISAAGRKHVEENWRGEWDSLV
jgi:hypothetical protein